MWTHGSFWLLAHTLCRWISSLFPKVFVLSIMTWALYAFVILVESGFDRQWCRVLLESAMFFLYLLTLYTYFKVIVVGPGSPLDFPELKISTARVLDNPYDSDVLLALQISSQELSQDSLRSSTDSQAHDMAHLLGANGHSGSTKNHRSPPSEIFISHTFKNNAPAYRWCSTCEVWKPDRCHHCSTCNRCFLKMDHHCPWFACCIGFYNQKFFIQVLIYITVYSAISLAVSFSILYRFFIDEQWDNNHYLSLNLVFLFVVSLAFFVAMSLFTGFSLYMILCNTTTIEFQDNRWGYLEHKSGQYEFDSNGKKQTLGHIYDLGRRKNWTSVFGQSWIGWVFPTAVTSRSLSAVYNNGINFEVDEELYNKYCYNAQLQDQLNQQLSEYRDRIRGSSHR